MPLITTRSNASARGYGAFLAAAAASSTSFESIATVSVGSGGASNVEFTSIPSTYTHLQIRGIARSNRAGYPNDGIIVQYNSDTGSNYAYHELSASGDGGVSAGSSANTSLQFIQGIAGSTASASVFGGFVIDILDYKNTNKYKTLRANAGYDGNGNGYRVFSSILWLNTNAINSIKFTQRSGNTWEQYTSFALYGIKGAA